MNAMLQLEWFLKSLLLLTSLVYARSPPQPEDINISGTSFLDHDTPISGFWGRTFLQENIPFIDIPDTNIQDVYYYRFSSLQRHLRYTTAGTGYILTEFCQPVEYAQRFDTIDAAAGHQIDEARWLRSKFYDDDYIQVYARGQGNTTQYTHWILDAMYRRSQVTGDTEFITDQLDDMIRLWGEWDYTFDSSAGLYYFTPVFDSQEYSLPGYVTAPSGNDLLQMEGPDTYRPSLNSYMVANAKAIANVAGLANDDSVASNFTSVSNNIEAAMYEHLWDPVQQFFMDVIRPNNSNLTQLIGREEVGLYPFRFGVGLDPTYSSPSVRELFDPQGFLAEYGPNTLEQRNRYYNASKDSSSYCCFWNGQSWPFSTAHTLKSLAAIYRTGNSSITVEQYVQYLRIYAATQQKNGMPYVAESHYPLNDSWSADTLNHSEHYDHSTNNDDVITGLLGIIPRSDHNLEISPIIPKNWTYFAIENLAYHGRLVTVLYDQDGSKYKNGSGLSVFVDGAKIYNGHGTKALVPLPPASKLTTVIPINIAANPNGIGSYPMASATFTFPLDDPYKLIDGYLFYDHTPDNRWTNYLSSTANDTLKITFARPRNISSVTLALYSDVARGGGVDVPAAIEIYSSSGLLTTVTESDATLLPNDRNTFSFSEVETEFVAVNMFNKPHVYVGVCELEVWTPPIPGPVYYAVDALLTDAVVMTDSRSTATSNGAVVGKLIASSVVTFSGIVSTGGTARITLGFANAGSNDAHVEVIVNQVPQVGATLFPSKGKYVSVSVEVPLGAGKNFVSLTGGKADVKYELLQVTVS